MQMFLLVIAKEYIALSPEQYHGLQSWDKNRQALKLMGCCAESGSPTFS